MRWKVLALLCLLTIGGVAADEVAADETTPLDHGEEEQNAPGAGFVLAAIAAIAVAGVVRRRG